MGALIKSFLHLGLRGYHANRPGRIEFSERTPVAHKFAVGQTVDVVRKVLRPAASGSYEILALVPAPDSDPQDPCYRIKNTDEKHERIIPESELTLSPRTGAVSNQKSGLITRMNTH